MARTRRFGKYGLPSEVVGIAVAIIADYDRRAREIRKGALSEDLLSSYKRYNGIVDDALSHIEETLRREMLDDIACGRGHRHSNLSRCLTDASYYARKRQIIYYTAYGLGLAEEKQN